MRFPSVMANRRSLADFAARNRDVIFAR